MAKNCYCNNLWVEKKYGAYVQYDEKDRTETATAKRLREGALIKGVKEIRKTFLNSHAAAPIAGFTAFQEDLEVFTTTQYGRGIRSRNALNFNDEIIREKPFAIVASLPNGNVQINICSTCYHTGGNLIVCETCRSVAFCDTCRQNSTHYLECESIFQYITILDIKLGIQMILESITMFDSFDQLQTHVERLVRNKRIRQTPPDAVNTRISQLNCMLSLSTGNLTEQICNWGDDAFTYLMNMPQIQRMCHKKGAQRFLLHLARNFVAVAKDNSFRMSYDQAAGGEGELQQIYCVFSLINHSCIPNASFIIEENELICRTLRQIDADEEITISYLSFLDLNQQRTNVTWEQKNDRHTRTRNEWNFECACALCLGDDIPVHIITTFWTRLRTKNNGTIRSNAEMKQNLERQLVTIGRDGVQRDAANFYTNCTRILCYRLLKNLVN